MTLTGPRVKAAVSRQRHVMSFPSVSRVLLIIIIVMNKCFLIVNMIMFLLQPIAVAADS